MDANTRKTTLRMIPYGLYVLTSASADGRVAAATVNWVTQASFEPPLVVVGVKADSGAHALIKETKAFALNVLGKGQGPLAFTFFNLTLAQEQPLRFVGLDNYARLGFYTRRLEGVIGLLEEKGVLRAAEVEARAQQVLREGRDGGAT